MDSRKTKKELSFKESAREEDLFLSYCVRLGKERKEGRKPASGEKNKKDVERERRDNGLFPGYYYYDY